MSFASITLNTNMIFLKIYDTKKLLFFYKSVKLEYCENLKTIWYRNLRHFLTGFKNGLDFLTWWFRPKTYRKILHNLFLKVRNIICAIAYCVGVIEVLVLQLWGFSAFFPRESMFVGRNFKWIFIPIKELSEYFAKYKHIYLSCLTISEIFSWFKETFLYSSSSSFDN